jgi:gamma-glutamyltranspeptidase/glutathione hydrolase
MLALVHARAGRLPWARLFGAAIARASDGFPLPPYLHSVLLKRSSLARKAPFSTLYFDAKGVVLPVGKTIRNPTLAASLRRIADEGADAFYRGDFAAEIIASAAEGSYPGTITEADLADYEAHEREPVCAHAFGRRICTAAPPVAGGIAVLQQLVMLDRLGLTDIKPGSVEAAHLLIEVSRLAAADRRTWVGDPDQVSVPTAGLLDTGYLADRAALVSPDRALATVSPGNPPEHHGEALPSEEIAPPATTHLAIVDDAGNAVSFTTTINLDFGADRVAAGVALNNALTNFASKPVIQGQRVPDAPAPGKRPTSATAPTIVFGTDGKPELIVGAGGGARIIESVVETIAGIYAWRKNVREAIEAPRIGGQNRAQELERGTPAAKLADALRAMGHDPKVDVMNAGVQAVMVMGLFEITTPTTWRSPMTRFWEGSKRRPTLAERSYQDARLRISWGVA